MAILAPENGTRTTLTPDPLVPAGGGVTGAFQAALSAPWLAGSAAAIGVAAALRAMQQRTADAAAAAAQAAAAAARAIGSNGTVAVLPRDVPPAAPNIPRPGTLPPLAPLPSPPTAPGTRPGASPAAGAAGGGILLLVALALLAGTRRG